MACQSFSTNNSNSRRHMATFESAGCQVSAGWHKVAGMTDKNMAGFLPANPKNTATFLDQTRYSLRRNAAEIAGASSPHDGERFYRATGVCRISATTWRESGTDFNKAPVNPLESDTGPVSRILYGVAAASDHSSGPSITEWLKRPTRRLDAPSRHVPAKASSLPIWSCSVWGLPCPEHYCPGGALLPHLFTLTPASRPGRYAFCCAFRLPILTPASRTLSGTLLCGVRTFLHLLAKTAITQPNINYQYYRCWASGCDSILSMNRALQLGLLLLPLLLLENRDPSRPYSEMCSKTVRRQKGGSG